MELKFKYRAVPLCLLLLLLSAACSKNEPGTGGGAATLPGVAGNNASGATKAVISENDKPADVLTRAMRAQLDAKSYRARINTTSPDGTASMLVEYAAPDSYRMTGESQPGGDAKAVKMEYVIVGGATYLKTPNGQWIRSPVDAGQMIKGFRDPKMLDELAKSTDVKLVGPDTIDGMPMLVYQYTQTNPLGLNLKADSKTWVSVADGLPRKTESEGEMGGKKSKTLITMSDYNADIKIEAPMK
ncbi:MAG TPA: hypothetical protein VGW12_21190 [Pyrinomonadaceae bacterium]|nr:hypothetical protein [Pyrinomonadaceae bacterium]